MIQPVSMQAELRELQGAEDTRLRALVDGDLDTLQSLFDNDLIVTHSNGRREGREAFLRAYVSGAVRYLQMQQDISTTTLRHDHAVISAVLRARIAVLGGVQIDVHALSTTVWTRATDDEGWRLLAVHTTSIPVNDADPTRQRLRSTKKEDTE